MGLVIDFTGTTDAFLLVSSSEESESDDESFFVFLLRLAGGTTAAVFVTGVAFARDGPVQLEGVVEGIDLPLLAEVGTSSESELELVDETALRLIGWAGAATVGLAGCFFVSSSDESEEDVSCFFLLFD